MNELATYIKNYLADILQDTPKNQSNNEIIYFFGPSIPLLELIAFDDNFEKSALASDIDFFFVRDDINLSEIKNININSKARVITSNDLLKIRNDPNRKNGYLALISPNIDLATISKQSLKSTYRAEGTSPANGNNKVQFDDWWNDGFIQRIVQNIVKKFISAFTDLEQKSYAELISKIIKYALQSIFLQNEIDEERYKGLWFLLSKIYEIFNKNHQENQELRLLCITCGFPKIIAESKETLKFENIKKIINQIAETYSSFTINSQSSTPAEYIEILDELQEKGEDYDYNTIKKALTIFSNSIPREPSIKSSFLNNPLTIYSSIVNHNKEELLYNQKTWWDILSIDIWELLYQTNSENKTFNLTVSCTNSIINDSINRNNKIPFIVQDFINLEITSNELINESLDGFLTITPKSQKSIQFTLNDNQSFKTTYTIEKKHNKCVHKICAKGENYTSNKISVISLADWNPFVFFSSPNATSWNVSSEKIDKKTSLQWNTTMDVRPGEIRLIWVVKEGCKLISLQYNNNSDEIIKHEKKDKNGTFYWSLINTDNSSELIAKIEDEDGNKIVHNILFIIKEEEKNTISSYFEKYLIDNVAPKNKSIQVIADNNTKFGIFEKELLISARSNDKFQNKLSCYPFIIADDYDVQDILEPNYRDGKYNFYSKTTPNFDLRPNFNNFKIPDSFLEIRKKLFNYIFNTRNTDSSSDYLIEEIDFVNKDFFDRKKLKELIITYISEYKDWLANNINALYLDITLLFKLQNSNTLPRDPYALVLSPLHPLKIAWQFMAQLGLNSTLDLKKPCPGASILDSNSIPALILLRLSDNQDPDVFYSVESSSYYWGIYVNHLYSRDINQCLEQSILISENSGLSIESLEGSFNEAQVNRSLDDISNLLITKPYIDIAIYGEDGINNQTNFGIYNWLDKKIEENEDNLDKSYSFYDFRNNRLSHLSSTKIASLSENSLQKIQWYDNELSSENINNIDLGIIAQITSTSPKVIKNNKAICQNSVLSANGLVAYKIRNFSATDKSITTSLTTRPSIISEQTDQLHYIFINCLDLFENNDLNHQDTNYCRQFTPDLMSINKLIDNLGSKFVAVSSATLDPSIFAINYNRSGTWLWDYELPSFSSKSGDINGYYLVTKNDEVAVSSLTESLNELLSASTGYKFTDNNVKAVLDEISKRGIPKIKSISSFDNTSHGDIGVVVACRFLQDKIRLLGKEIDNVLLPITEKDINNNFYLNMLVPVDPFQKQIDELSTRLNLDKNRPDLLACSILLKIQNDKDFDVISLKITPIEVKFRNLTISSTAKNGAKTQAESFAKLINSMNECSEDSMSLWKLTSQHLLMSMLSYAFKLYTSFIDTSSIPPIYKIEQKIANVIFGDYKNKVNLDKKGRVIIIEDTSQQGVDPDDHYIYHLTIKNAQKIMSDNADDISNIYKLAIKALRDWDLKPDYKLNEQEITTDTVTEIKANNAKVHNTDIFLNNIRILLGNDINNNIPVYWEFGNSSLSNRHILITGTSGCGKTYCIQTILYELLKNNISSFIIDYTNGFIKKQLNDDFKNKVANQLHEHFAINEGFQINPFTRQLLDFEERESNLEPIYIVANRISTTLSSVYSFGDQQKSCLSTAASNGLNKYGKGMNLKYFKSELELLCEDPIYKNIAPSVVSKMKPLFDFIESTSNNNNNQLDWHTVMYPEKACITIFQLAHLDIDSQKAISEFMLYDAWYYSQKNGSKDKPFFVVLDEMQKLDHAENFPCALILTEGRKFGWSACFATQSISTFNNDEIPRLQQAAVKLYFQPTESDIRKISGFIDSNDKTAWINQINKLKKGTCIITGDRVKPDGTFGSALPAVTSITSLEERE